MKIYAIKSDSYPKDKVLAWLIYYKQFKKFYIELPQDANEWDTPLILSSFATRGIRTVNSYWSKVWVQQRIVPVDRQNLGQILKDNGLAEYDEYSLLMLDDGRCAQDDYYLESCEFDDLPDDIKERFLTRVVEVIPLSGYNLIVFFNNGEAKKCNISKILKSKRDFIPVYENDSIYNEVRVLPGGYGIGWDDQTEISDTELYTIGVEVSVPLEAFLSFLKHRTLNGAETANVLNCSRQNIEQLIKRNRLHPIKTAQKNKLFMKGEVEQRGVKRYRVVNGRIISEECQHSQLRKKKR